MQEHQAEPGKILLFLTTQTLTENVGTFGSPGVGVECRDMAIAGDHKVNGMGYLHHSFGSTTPVITDRSSPDSDATETRSNRQRVGRARRRAARDTRTRRVCCPRDGCALVDRTQAQCVRNKRQACQCSLLTSRLATTVVSTVGEAHTLRRYVPPPPFNALTVLISSLSNLFFLGLILDDQTPPEAVRAQGMRGHAQVLATRLLQHDTRRCDNLRINFDAVCSLSRLPYTTLTQPPRL